MRYKPCVYILLILIIFALIPILLVIKLKWDAVLPIIIYFQLLLIWIQAEISLRQHTLFSAQFEPFFDVKRTGLSLQLSNKSINPAYGIWIGRILDEQNKPISPDIWRDKISTGFTSSLLPKQEIQLCSFKCSDDFFKGKTIEILYLNRLGELREVHVKILENGGLLVIPESTQLPGILLRILEDLSIYLRLIRYRHEPKKIIRNTQAKTS